MHNKINLGNINHKIQFAILSILDVYFQLKMHPISPINIASLNTTIKSMQAHVLSVWFIKQSLLNSKRMDHKSINMHKVIHMPYYTYYGSYLKLDTSSFESSHKVLTKGMYNKTSRQTNILNKDMLIKSIEYDISQQYSFIGNALTLSIEEHLEEFKLPDKTETITFNLIPNLSYYYLQFSKDHKEFILHDNNNNLINDPMTILNHSSHTVANMLSVLDQIFPNNNRDDVIEALDNKSITIAIRSGVTYHANVESGMGSGHLYATSRLRNSILRPRYDYILANVQETKTNSYVQPAQLLAILEVTKWHNGIEIDTKVYYAIQYLREPPKNISQGSKSPFKLYTWEYKEGGNTTTNPKYNIGVISHDEINGQAYIFPFFNQRNNPRNNFTSTNDLFWLVDRKYFDRSGWEDYTESIINERTGILLNPGEMREIEKSLRSAETPYTSLYYLVSILS